MWIANFIGGGIIFLFGIALRFGNYSSLLAGYNTMSEEKKKKWNEKAITRFVGNLFIVEAIIVIFGGILVMHNIAPQTIMIMSWSVFGVLHIIGIIYVNKSSRFKQIK